MIRPCETNFSKRSYSFGARTAPVSKFWDNKNSSDILEIKKFNPKQTQRKDIIDTGIFSGFCWGLTKINWKKFDFCDLLCIFLVL